MWLPRWLPPSERGIHRQGAKLPQVLVLVTRAIRCAQGYPSALAFSAYRDDLLSKASVAKTQGTAAYAGESDSRVGLRDAEVTEGAMRKLSRDGAGGHSVVDGPGSLSVNGSRENCRFHAADPIYQPYVMKLILPKG